MNVSFPVKTSRQAMDAFVALCRQASPSELWALLSTDGRMLPLGMSAPGAGWYELSVDALMVLGAAEKSKNDGVTWLLAHSHPLGRAVLSARDRIALTRGGAPVWPFAVLVVGLSPHPAAACYEWDAPLRTFLRKPCPPLDDTNEEAITAPVRSIHRA